MRKLTAKLCLTITVLLGSVGVGVGGETGTFKTPQGYQAFKNQSLVEIERASKEQLAVIRAFNNVYYSQCKRHKSRPLFDSYYKIVAGPIMERLLPRDLEKSVKGFATNSYWQGMYNVRKKQFLKIRKKVGFSEFCDRFIQIRLFGKPQCYNKWN